MKCDELLALLNDYVDGTVEPAICEQFEAHMAGCNPCQVVVDNIRKTITLYKHGKRIELPEVCPNGFMPHCASAGRKHINLRGVPNHESGVAF